MDPAILYGLDRVGDLDQLAGSGLGICVGTGGGEFIAATFDIVLRPPWWPARASVGDTCPSSAGKTKPYLQRTYWLFAFSDSFHRSYRVHAAAGWSSLSGPRATILRASSANGLCNALASSQGAHPNVALLIGRQNHRHGLGVDRLDHGVRRGGHVIDDGRKNLVAEVERRLFLNH
jgi:hypothetical protein